MTNRTTTQGTTSLNEVGASWSSIDVKKAEMYRRPSRTRRHTIGALVLGALISILPIADWSAPAYAEAPAAAVVGLSRGDRGEPVVSVQAALVTQGVAVAGGVDGVFGAATESAVRSFQESNGLPVTGSVDQATAIALGLVSSPLLGLTQGTRGDTVAELQRRLTIAGFTPAGGADGIFGPGTTKALQAFQTSIGLTASGTVDAATAARLAAAGSAPEAGQGSDTVPAAPSTSLVGLKIGARGEAVRTLQQKIMHAGFTVVGGADGVFGALTAAALTSFQNANGLDASGVVDEATAAVLAQVGAGDAESSHDPSAASSPLVGLRFGSVGSDVSALQNLLIERGIAVRGGADGVFGPATESALKQFQADREIEQTGVVDEATANALASEGGSAATSTLVGLEAGALGNTVKQLQQALIDAGITVRGGADGIFGPATAEALRAFQASQGLPETGVVDRATADALASPRPVGVQNPGATGGYAQYGEKGPRVTALQSALVAAGVPLTGGVDGSFGGATSAAVMEFQRRNGLAVSGKVDDATGAALGLDRQEAPAAPDPSTVELSVFPVQGPCGFTDTWGAPRSGGRTHMGVDIIASEGNLIYAVADGTIEKVYVDFPGSLAGNGARLRMADGTYFFYAHLLSLAEGIDVGTQVVAGQVIGLLGNTGNSGTPHLHFEIHPDGGAAVNPYPMVKAIDGCSITEPLPQP